MKDRSVVVFDIETGPRPLDEIKSLLGPFDVVGAVGPRPGEFDPNAVKTGNIKDPVKIQEKIDAAKAAHASAEANYDTTLADAEEKHWADIESRAALDANLGEVIAIGYRTESRTMIHHADELSESDQLKYFWDQFRKFRQAGRRLVGWNSNAFDVPFIARRSFIVGVDVPGEALTQTGWLDQTFVDVLARWQFGNKRDYCKLDVACRSMGLPGKPEGITGAMFHSMYRSGDKDQKLAALQYLENDLEMTWKLAERMGVV